MNANGKVGVRTTNENVKSYFAVNARGYNNICTYIEAYADTIDTALRVLKEGSLNYIGNNYNKALDCKVSIPSNSTKMGYGIYSQAFRNNGFNSTNGRSYGVYSVAGTSTSGWNYGVFGTLCGTNNGAGVFGSSTSNDTGMNTEGRFGGFFHGDVKSTDAMYATAFNTTSDYRLKENIESIDSESINNIMKLNVVKYNLKQLTIDTGDTATTQEYYYTNDSKLLERKHYGLIAQELKEIYPDLVYESENGYFSINYVELVPILVKSIQELTSKVEILEGVSAKTTQRDDKNTMIGGLNLQTILYQNDPNPFTENTTIKCVIPNGIRNAVLYIYDMNGHQIDSRTITERGNASLTIEGNSLEAGMYLYSLITDGTVVDTKRMILTK